ncbi:MAG TPA: gamma-glutamyltransferase [Burkholderiales bacterium]|nr:gamma-glutamyltransferase [Burkholderiales bacterium]
MKTALASLALLVLCSPALAQRSPDAPEAASTVRARALVTASRHMIVAAHPIAAQAGLAVLREGGNAVDAAVATALVLNVVEPQSSGIGGGGFLLHYRRAAHRMTVWDGRETAPDAADSRRFTTADGRPLRFMDAVGSGLSVGVPGLLAMLEAAHSGAGHLPWSRLVQPAIDVAERGFAISPRLAELIAVDPLLGRSPSARRFFYRPDGTPRRAGERMTNPELAAVLRLVARQGASAFYRGALARDIAAAVRAAPMPGDLDEADLNRYQALRRDALCGPYRAYRICGVPPPSSGAVSVLELLALLEPFPMAALKNQPVDAVHVFAEAGRLAYADRDRYLADPAFVPQPVAQLLDPAYLRERSGLIDPARAMGRALPGRLAGAPAVGADRTLALPATSHVSVVDDAGDAVSLTASVESAFGSRILVHGFLLNNQLTDFSFLPNNDTLPAANRVEPDKRPRSSMAPTLVFDSSDHLRWVLGSPGGPMIINYVAKALVGLIDWNLDAQAASALPNMGNRNGVTELEAGTPLEKLAPALRARGHDVRLNDQTSGLNIIELRRAPGNAPDVPALEGGTDPRREGVALGD